MSSVNTTLTRLIAILIGALLLIGCSNGGGDTPSTDQLAPPPSELASDSAIKISVVENGVYRLTQRDLERAGLEVSSLSVDQLSLTAMGEQVPYVIQDDALLFYGVASDSRYSRVTPYILRSGEAGTLMDAVAAPDGGDAVTLIPQTVSIERNWQYEQRAADSLVTDGTEVDTWFWQRIANVGNGSTLEFTLDLPAVGGDSAELNLNMWGLTHIAEIENDHDFDLIVNGETVETVMFDGQSFHTSSTAIPTSLLKTGENTFTIDNTPPGNAVLDQFLFNYATLNFMTETEAIDGRLEFTGVTGSVTVSGIGDAAIVLDVSDPASPKQIDNLILENGAASFGATEAMQLAAYGDGGYLTANNIVPLIETDLRDTVNQADLLIVTTRELSPELDPLVTARMEQGLTVKVVHIDELYDEFADGAVTPDAIQNFVTYAFDEWAAPAPSYLFLIGDSTTDMLGNGATRPDNPVLPPTNLVPSPIVEVSHAGETVADARLADVDGDLKPDLAVGRWPVDTAQQVRDLVRRTLAYEEGTVSERSLFTFDGSSNEFSTFTDRIITQSGLPPEEVQMMSGPTSAEVAEQWNDGAWLVSYVGHGSVNLWGADEVLTQDAVSDIRGNDTAPPIVMQWSCLTGHFGFWEADSISETMLTQDNGPVLLVASTSLTLSSHQSPFAIAFVTGLQNPEYERIGDALQAAKAGLLTQGNAGLQEISDTFGLIGDPSTRIVRPESVSAN